MMFVVIFANVLGSLSPPIQSIISRAAMRAPKARRWSRERSEQLDGGRRAGGSAAAARRRLAPAEGRLAHRQRLSLLCALQLSAWAGGLALSGERRQRVAAASLSAGPSPDRHARQYPDPRLRLQGHATDRRPHRGAHVFCEVHPNDVGRLHPRFQAEGDHPSGSHASTYETRTCGPGGGLAAWRAGAWHLLRHVHDGGATRRRRRGEQPREFGYAEVRARGHTTLLAGIEDFSTAEGHGMLKVWMTTVKVTALRPASSDGLDAELPVAGMADEERRYTRSVPSGGHAHPEGARHPEPLSSQSPKRSPMGDGHLRRGGGARIRDRSAPTR